MCTEGGGGCIVAFEYNGENKRILKDKVSSGLLWENKMCWGIFQELDGEFFRDGERGI